MSRMVTESFHHRGIAPDGDEETRELFQIVPRFAMRQARVTWGKPAQVAALRIDGICPACSSSSISKIKLNGVIQAAQCQVCGWDFCHYDSDNLDERVLEMV